jgi:hypothetical protein
MKVTVESQDELGIIRMSVETGGPLLQPDAAKAYADSLASSLIRMIELESKGDEPEEPRGFFVPNT